MMCMHESESQLRDVGFVSYEVRAGVHEQEAIELFKKFYARENSKAPVPKRSNDEGKDERGGDEGRGERGDGGQGKEIEHEG